MTNDNPLPGRGALKGVLNTDRMPEDLIREIRGGDDDDDWTDAHGTITAYPDIPSEYLVGLDRGKLGDWLQEVHDAGWLVIFHFAGVNIQESRDAPVIPGWDYTTNRADIAFLRAYLVWKEKRKDGRD